MSRRCIFAVALWVSTLTAFSTGLSANGAAVLALILVCSFFNWRFATFSALALATQVGQMCGSTSHPFCPNFLSSNSGGKSAPVITTCPISGHLEHASVAVLTPVTGSVWMPRPRSLSL